MSAVRRARSTLFDPEPKQFMEAKLIVIVGRASKPVIDLKLPTIIGRGRDAGLTIAHPMVSRRHCELFEEDGLLMVRDLGSTNGTFLQGRRIDAAPLLPEAQFTVGPLTFRTDYRYDGDPEALPPVQFSEEKPAATEAGGDVTDEEPDFLAFEEEEGEEAAAPEAAASEAVGDAAPEAAAEAADQPAGDADELSFEECFEEELAGDAPVEVDVTPPAADDNLEEEEPEPAPPPNLPPPIKRKQPPSKPKKPAVEPVTLDAPEVIEDGTVDVPQVLDRPEVLDHVEVLDQVEVIAVPEIVADEPASIPVLAEPELAEEPEPEALAEPELAEEPEPEALAEPELVEPEPPKPKAKRATHPEPEMADIEGFLGGLD